MSEIEIDPSAPENSVLAGVTKAWGKIVVPFYRESNLSNVDAEVLGSGFFGKRGGRTFLITALHVIEDIANEPARGLMINDKFFWLRNCYFLRDRENDLAVTDAAQIQASNPSKDMKVSAIPLDNPRNLISADAFVLMGYPGSQNKLLTRFKKLDRKIYSCSLNTSTCTDVLSECKIKDKIRFGFDRKKITDGHNQRYTAPDLAGMSGSPILEVHPKPTGLEISLKAVLVEEHRRTKELVGAGHASLIKLIDYWSDQVAPPNNS